MGAGRASGSSTSSARSIAPQDAAALVATLVERRADRAAPGTAFLEEHPLILSPIWTQPPFPHGWDVESEANAARHDAADAAR